MHPQQPGFTAPPQDRTLRRVIIGAIIAVVVGVTAVVIVALALDGSDEPQDATQAPSATTTTMVYAPPPEPVDTGPDFQAAKDECAPKSNRITVMDSGTTMQILIPADADGLNGAACVLGSVGVNEALFTRIVETRGLDGIQRETVDDVELIWHADGIDGISIVLERTGGTP